MQAVVIGPPKPPMIPVQGSVKGEVISSTFDEPAVRHVQVAETDLTTRFIRRIAKLWAEVFEPGVIGLIVALGQGGSSALLSGGR